MLFIQNGKVLTMTDNNYEKADVVINKGKIEQVGKNLQVPPDSMVIDATGLWVLPGLIEAHCHLGMFEEGMGFEGNDGNESTEPITPHLRAIDAINPLDGSFKEAIKAGITAVSTGPGSANVIGGQFAVIKTKGISIDDMVIMEPAAMKIAFGENPKRVYNSKGKMPMTRMGTVALLRETLTKAKNYKNKKQKAKIKDEYFEKDLRMEALIPVINKEIPLKAHAHRADDIMTAIRIAKEFDVKLTLDHCTEGEIIAPKIKEAKVDAIVGPTFSFKGKVETKNKSFKTPAVLVDNQVKIAITTDHPVVPIKYLTLCAALAVKEGLSEENALKAITINAAEILNIENRVGSIEQGKDADIAIFDGNPLNIMTNIVYTIIDGKIVYENK